MWISKSELNIIIEQKLEERFKLCIYPTRISPKRDDYEIITIHEMIRLIIEYLDLLYYPGTEKKVPAKLVKSEKK